MRKHSARKWLHFVLDLLPILVLPIFAIYEINHDHNEPITVTDGAWEHRAKYETNDVDTLDDLIEGNIYHLDTLTITETNVDTYEYLFQILNCDSFQTNCEINYDGGTTYGFNEFTFSLEGFGDNEPYITLFSNNDGLMTKFNIMLTFDNDNGITFNNFDFIYERTDTKNWLNDNNYLPSASDFNVIEYVYNENHVYDNTDIGSQMLYAIYKPVKDYFNFNNVFNFGDIYHWFELNMFGGNAPMPIFIVWNIIVYQFLMDLMFLVYSIFMFIIDFTSECLERCFSFSRHGGSR